LRPAEHPTWDAAEPGNGNAEKAAQWRAKLEEIEATKPRSDEGEGDQGGSPNEGHAETPK